MTREELMELICPTDATYNCNQGNCSASCDKCEDILNYLLDRYDAKVRADAIEECLNVVEWDGYTLDIKKRIENLKQNR